MALLAVVSVAMARDGSGASGGRGGDSISRSAAVHAALKALGVRQHKGAVIVFALPTTVGKGTVIDQAGPAQPAGAGASTSSPAGVLATATGSSWVFYEDLAPFTQYAHGGRVALVNASTGHVTVSAKLSWPPSIGHRLLVFLRTQKAYDGTRYRVFYTPYRGARKPPAGNPGAASEQARFRPALGKRVAQLLARQHACAITASETVPGLFYSWARLTDSRAALNARLDGLGGLDSGYRTFNYAGGGQSTLMSFAEQRISQHGCRDVLLYLAGGGYPGKTAVNLGMAPGSSVTHQDVTPSALRSLIAGHRNVRFELMIDAPASQEFLTLTSLRNVMVVATPPKQTFTYLPEALINGRMTQNRTRPQRLSQFTKRLAYGLTNAVNSACEVGQLETLTGTGRVPSAQAYVLIRALARGASSDFPLEAGLSGPPMVAANIGADQGPGCQSNVHAAADSYAATNRTRLSVSAARGLLSNDTDSAGFSVSVDRLNGAGGTFPLRGKSAHGAAITLRRDGSFTYDPSGSSVLQALRHGRSIRDSFTYRGDDGHGGNSTATVTITVTGAINHPPVAVADSYATNTNQVLSVTQASKGVLANDTDADGDTLTVDRLNGGSALTGTSAKGAAVTLNANGTFTYDATGSATLQALIRGQTTTDTFTYRVNDGHGGTDTATVTITLTGVNHPPVANPDSYSVSNNTSGFATAASGVLANDTDADGDTLTVDELNGTGGTAPFTGTSADGATVTLNADGSFTYDPTGSATLQAIPRGQTLADTFTYEASDGHGGTDTATVTITVTGVINHPPVAFDDSYSTSNNASLTVDTANGVLANDTDIDGDSLTVDELNGTGGAAPFVATTTDGASITLNADGSFTYDPTGSATLQALKHGETTTDSFTYEANDGNGGTDTATVTITVTGVNHPPVANPDAYAANNNAVLDTSSASGVLANDTDADGDTLTVDQLNGTGGTAPFTGTSADGAAVTLNADGSFTYDPTASSILQAIPRGQSVDDTFTYEVNDGNGGTDTATVTITVTGAINHPPVAVNDSYAVANDATLTENAAGGVLTNDTDLDGDSLTVDQLNGASSLSGTSADGAAVTLNADGSFTYDPTGSSILQAIPRGQSVDDTFTYEVNDGNGGTDTATVTITVNGAVNHPPVAFDDSYSTNNNASLTVGTAAGVLANDTDADGDALTVDQLNGTGGTAPFTGTSADGAAVTLNADGSFTYDPTGSSILQAIPRGQSVDDTFTYEANDGHGGTDTATVTVTVTGVINHPPVAVNDSYTVGNDTVLAENAAGGVLANDTDPDGDALTVDQLNGTGGTAPFTATTAKGASITLNADGSFTYDPTGSSALEAIPRGQSTTDTFTYEANDGNGGTSTATVTITVTGVINHPPVAVADSYATQSNQVLTATPASDGVLANDTDPDSDTLTVDQLNGTGGTAPFTGTSTKGASVTLNSDGTFTYDPTGASQLQPPTLPIGQSTTDTFTYEANDGHGGTSTATVTVTVTGADTPPTANSYTVSTTAVGNTLLEVGTVASPSSGPKVTDSNSSDSILANASDPDLGDSISITGFESTSSQGGQVSVDESTGGFSYEPPAGFTGADTFTYTVTDTHGMSATGTVTINVSNLVWYVDDSQSSAGDGRSSSPFNTLAAGNSAAGSNSIIFLYQGSATYTGGVTMHSGESLFGQPHGLSVGGNSLVAAGGSNPTITNSGGDGIDLAENADVEAVNISNPSANGVASSGVNDATVGGTDSVGISGAGTDGIHISGGNGALNFAKATVTGSTGHSLSVATRAGGTSTFGGNLTDHGTGISLTSNAGATINLGGTLAISTGANPGFTATGGGTVSANGSGSTITTTTASAANVQNTTIGSNGLNFQSISTNGANPGINLANTGTSGGLTVTGTGSAGTGGTIQSSAGPGVKLSSTSSPSFTDMVIKNNASDGINGSQVAGLTLAGSTVSANGTQASVSGENDDGLDFSPNGTGSPNGLTGTVTISNSTITTSADNNAIISDTSGSLNLTVTGTTVSSNNSTTGNDGLHIDADGSTNATVSVTGSTFTNNFGDHFQFSTDSAATGTNSVTFSNNTLTTTASGVLGGGVVISPFGNSHTTLTLNSNNIQGSVFTGIAVDEDGSTGTLSGTINGNTIGTAATANSGSQGNNIGVFAEGSVTETLAITNNNLFQYDNEAGISFLQREGSPTMNLTITGNTIADPGTFGSWGLLGEAGAETGDGGAVCAAISGNSIKGSAQAGQGGADFELDQEFNTTIKLPGYTGGSQNTSAVVSFIQGNNTGNGTPSGIATVSGSGGGFVDAASCPAPS